MPGNIGRIDSGRRDGYVLGARGVDDTGWSEAMIDICPFCEHEIDPETDRCLCVSACPCGCGFDEFHPGNNCVYDTPAQRHLKNLINGLPDEDWVKRGLESAKP